MQKKILMAVDDSMSAKCAVSYATAMSKCITDLSYTLFTVQPGVSPYILDEAKTNLKAKFALDKMVRQNREKAQKILDGHKSEMCQTGLSEDRINTKTTVKQLGTAEDILETAMDGMYDAVVIGRRGLSKLEQIFAGSVTANLLEHGGGVPIWVVDGNVRPSDILVAVDGSESSLRAVDHVAFMFSKNTNTNIVMVHVVPKTEDIKNLSGDAGIDLEEIIKSGRQKKIKDFYVAAMQKFMDAEVPKERVHLKELPPQKNPGKAVIDEAVKSGYATIVVGRRNIKKSAFMGSVSRHIIQYADNKAVWLVA